MLNSRRGRSGKKKINSLWKSPWILQFQQSEIISQLVSDMHSSWWNLGPVQTFPSLSNRRGRITGKVMEESGNVREFLSEESPVVQMLRPSSLCQTHIPSLWFGLSYLSFLSCSKTSSVLCVLSRAARPKSRVCVFVPASLSDRVNPHWGLAHLLPPCPHPFFPLSSSTGLRLVGLPSPPADWLT